MTREKKARYITMAVIAAAAAVVIGQKASWRLPAGVASSGIGLRAPEPPRVPEPRDAIYKMLDAARAGDANAYLGCFSGQMATMLQQSLSEMGPQAFSQYLVNMNKEIKGVALSEPAQLTDREVRVRVEYVFQDRNEAQQMFLEKAGDGWRIARVDSTERVKTLVPYGTPVY
jgi:hypothetical protein